MTSVIIISCYLGLLLLLGLSSSRLFSGSGKDYQLAGHSIGPFMLLMSLFGTTMTAFALIGSTGEAWQNGIGVYGKMASSSAIVHSLCFFLIGVRVWKLGHKHGYTTQIEFFRDRLQSPNIGLILFPILVAMVIVYILAGILGAGTVVNVFTSGAFPELFPGNPAVPPSVGAVPAPLGSLVICCVVLIYVFFGGMRGTAWANTFQTLAFMVLGVLTFFVIASGLGEGTAIENMRAASAAVDAKWASRSDTSPSVFLSYMFIPLSVGMFPHLFQHWLTAKSANSFKLAVVAHPICIMLVWVPCIMLGIWATTDVAMDLVKPLARLSHEAAGDQNKVLPMLVKGLSGPILGGFLSAGVLAAIMSSLDSQFLCMGTMFTNDIAKRYFTKGEMSDKQTVFWTRTFIILVVAVTYGFSLLDPRGVFGLGVWCFSGFSSLFPLIFAAVYWRRLTRAGAYACIIAAAATWGWLFMNAVNSGKPLSEFLLNVSVAGTSYDLMPVTAMIAVSTLAMVVVSLATKPPEEAHLKRFFS
ncbi:sodium:solute symporter family protein [Fuerstiella marisgermanici]|uniref:Proline permease n=1 Tax=Fuerstiella marisgermanici TaxID=1891926 RepID=A0A1P8WMM4_9PLAN|nr:sodium:solute symporter family protein [Fuerstiella marisgermanici]APZ95314.1 Proline permease [Fuerstiella marisgermanici]